MARRLLVFLTLPAAVAAVACSEDRTAPPAPPSTSIPPSRTATSSATATAAPAARGLAAPDNDARLVELAKKAAVCKWDNRGLSEECAPALAWADAPMGTTGGRSDPTLVNLLEDADDHIRWLAASKLHAVGRTFTVDHAIADRVVLAGERETSAHVGGALGTALADIQLDRTHTFDRVRAMAMKHALPSLRAALVANLAWKNPGSSAAYELTRELVRDPEKEVRAAAISAFYMGGGKRPEDTCQIWTQNLDNDMDGDVAAAANELVARWGRCQASYGALLESQAKRLEAGKTDSPRYPKALGFVCDDAKAAARDKERATELVRKVAETKTLDADVRAAALEAALTCDPAQGREFVKRFANDPPAQLKARAIDLLRPRAR
jgi:hypothetical protein